MSDVKCEKCANRKENQEDPLIALMCYWSTPCATTGVSPAELLMGRTIRTTLPTLEKNLRPKWPNKKTVMQKDASGKAKQAFYYNRHHGARPLPPLRLGGNLIVRLDKEKTWVTPAVVLTEDVTPRSYLLQTPQGAALLRNRRHLRFDNLPQPSAAALAPPAVTGTVVEPAHSTGSPITKTAPSTHLLTGRVCKPVMRLDL